QHPPPLVFRELSQIARQRRGGQDQNGGTGTRDRRRQPTVPEPRHPLGGADERRCPVGLVQPVLGGGEQELRVRGQRHGHERGPAGIERCILVRDRVGQQAARLGRRRGLGGD